jgi:PPOX class probable F420-dependent enzyme
MDTVLYSINNNKYVMTDMSKAEVARFLMHGTFTGKLATVKKDGSPHVVPIWFVVKNGKGRGKAWHIIFTTGDTSIKASNIQRDGRVSICIDDQQFPFSFVTIHGIAKIYPYKQKEVLEWSTKIAERYVGKRNAKTYGEVNGGEGAALVQIKPTKVIAEKDISILD